MTEEDEKISITANKHPRGRKYFSVFPENYGIFGHILRFERFKSQASADFGLGFGTSFNLGNLRNFATSIFISSISVILGNIVPSNISAFSETFKLPHVSNFPRDAPRDWRKNTHRAPSFENCWIEKSTVLSRPSSLKPSSPTVFYTVRARCF